MNKIDFMIIIPVSLANPNGDPTFDNRPRTTFDGKGLISDVCLKRKIRNRLQDMGEDILCDNRETLSMRERILSDEEISPLLKDKDKLHDATCRKWIDARAFGSVIATKTKDDSVSVGIRGAVSISNAVSIDTVDIIEIDHSNSFNREESGTKRDRTTFGNSVKLVEHGCYIAKGSIFPQLAEKTGLSDADVEKIKQALATLFVGDCSSARPAGSMAIRVYWWEHGSKYGDISPIRLFDSMKISPKENFPFYSFERGKIPESIKEEIFGDF